MTFLIKKLKPVLTTNSTELNKTTMLQFAICELSIKCQHSAHVALQTNDLETYLVINF